MARYTFLGGDPIDHFTLGRIAPGDVVELDTPPDGPDWTSARKKSPAKPDPETEEV